MKIKEATVYDLASSNWGIRTEQIAADINERELFHRKEGAPVSSKMVYAVIISHPGIFVKPDGMIRLVV